MYLPITQVPVGDMVATLGHGVASAQRALDDNAISTVRALQESWINLPNGKAYNLLNLGFTPAFYQFSEAVFSLRITMSMTTEEKQNIDTSKKRRGIFKSRSVNGEYSSRYQFSINSASTVNSRLLPRPTPQMLEARLQRINEAQK